MLPAVKQWDRLTKLAADFAPVTALAVGRDKETSVGEGKRRTRRVAAEAIAVGGVRSAIAFYAVVLGCGLILCIPTVRATDCSKPPVTLTAVAPDFPHMAFFASISGSVAVVVTIDKTGIVTDAQVTSELKDRSELRRNITFVFDSTAVNAAKRWLFNQVEEWASRQAILIFDFKQPTQKSEDVETIFRAPYTMEIRNKAAKIMIY